jgi:hypothetical protein
MLPATKQNASHRNTSCQVPRSRAELSRCNDEQPKSGHENANQTSATYAYSVGNQALSGHAALLPREILGASADIRPRGPTIRRLVHCTE